MDKIINNLNKLTCFLLCIKNFKATQKVFKKF